MDPEYVLNLFDSCWFNLEILNNNKSLSSISSKFVTNPSHQPRFSSLRSIIMRSKSDELSSMSSFNYGSNSMSPNSVLLTPQLQTIISGIESTPEEEKEKIQQKQEEEPKKSPTRAQGKPKRTTTRRRRTKSRGESKSLSDLEFEELKGFMDLGFVFSEKDKDSSLVEIIPGLQRLGQEKVDIILPKEQEIISPVKVVESSAASRRPYLSEAWEVLEMERKKEKLQNPLLMNWRVPSFSNEIDVKDSLKLWAQSVASVVR